jgi:hypothetical protein
MHRTVALLLTIFGIWVLALSAPAPTDAHHFDHVEGHAGYLYLPSYELNAKTTAATAIGIQTSLVGNWASALSTSISNWNSELSSVAGFSVYGTGTNVTVNAGSDVTQCGYLPGTNPPDPAHGCVTGWIPATPSATIYMYDPKFDSVPPVPADQTHRVSDLMHEMGHVLYNAGEHYPAYNCSSIMGHCPSYTTVSSHDDSDYRAAYRMKEAPNAAYGRLTSSSTFRHYFEGGYGGGNGYTLHAERRYWIDRLIGGVIGNYSTYSQVARKVDNNDDTTANNVSFNDLPSGGAEWCFKMRGEAGGVPIADTYYWGPVSKAYCLARAPGGAVYFMSDRNGSVFFTVRNYTSAQISNVVITLDDANKTQVCNLGNIAAGSSKGCSSTIAGPGYVDLFYDFAWVRQDTVGYDAE